MPLIGRFGTREVSSSVLLTLIGNVILTTGLTFRCKSACSRPKIHVSLYLQNCGMDYHFSCSCFLFSLLIISVMDSGIMMVLHTICILVYRLLFTMLHTYFASLST